MASNAGNRGKSAEKEVQKFLEAYDRKVAAFDWERKYDAHSAGGRFQRQTGDFAFYMPGFFGTIEVKEIEHSFRLPRKNFDTDQVAKLRKRQMAGGHIIVLVYHSKDDLWRSPFFGTFLKCDGASWDLSNIGTYPSAAAALDGFGCFE